ncbi:hypothetical protein [Butyrivibrio sp. INlla16]|uniref:hypothetical protein n=1 Tax=Butyrivibrio sp. INlla16 TaxID=1520807 RepID=UPI00088429B8|nr:hypothetical protein [Butyrivibrio sp. INlla16]SDB52338.1 hypothetical protein SAMN02910263_02652 [Butyrivibrio sp. INlla16]
MAEMLLDVFFYAQKKDIVDDKCVKCLRRDNMVTIETVSETNISQAALVHSISWKESHRSFCSEDFIEKHTPEHQMEYIRNKINAGTTFYLLEEG